MARERDGGGDLADADLDADLDHDVDAEPDGTDLDGSGRSPAARSPWRRSPRRRRRVVGVAVVVLAALVVTAAVRHARVDDVEPPRAAAPRTAEQLFPVLAQPAASSDDVDEPLAKAHDVVAGSSRRVTADAGLIFWVARDTSGGVCLLVRNATGPLRLGGACTSLEDAAARGVSLPGGNGVGAVLLPQVNDVAYGTGAGRGYREIASGLWVDRATAGRAACAASVFGSGC